VHHPREQALVEPQAPLGWSPHVTRRTEVGGDGDGLSIGMVHIPHAVRRDVNLTCAVLDNGIHRFTEGQASPTTAPVFKVDGGLAEPDEQPARPGADGPLLGLRVRCAHACG
jgi:hypothetical protein